MRSWKFSLLPCPQIIAAYIPIALCTMQISPAILNGQEEDLLSGELAKQYILMLCDGFDKNRHAFVQFTCRCHVVCGTTHVPSQWWKNNCWEQEVTNVEEEGEVLVAKDGDVFRYSFTRGKDQLHAEIRKGEFSMCLSSEHILADDKYVFWDDSLGPQAIISPRHELASGFYYSMTTPWQPRFLNERAFLDDLRFLITKYNARYKVRRNVAFGPEKLTVIYSGDLTGKYSVTEYYVDEPRGYMPRKILYVSDALSGARQVRVLYTEVSYVRGYGWFPMRWSAVSSPYGEDRQDKVRCFAIELRVTDLSIGRPKRELLQLKIPKGRHLIDQRFPPSAKPLVIPEDTFISVKDIPILLDRYRNPSKYVESARRGPRPSLWPRVVLVVLGVIAVLGIAYIGYRRWRSTNG